jgi:hypothetical protein
LRASHDGGKTKDVAKGHFERALVLAAALHVAAAVLLRVRRLPPAPALSHALGDVEVTEVDVLREPPPPATAASAPAAPSERVASATTHAHPGPAHPPEMTEETTTGGAEETSTPGPPSPSPSGEMAEANGPPHLTPEELGLAGPNRFLPTLDRDAGTALAEAKANVEEALRAPLRAHDFDLGLGPEGPVLRALEESAALGNGEVNGKATFEATLAADGSLLGLTVIDSNGPIEPWRAIARAATGKTGNGAGRHVGGRGVVARIEVETRWQLPSSHDPGTNVSILGQQVKKGDGPKSASVQILNPVPKIECSQIAGQNVCIPMLTLTILSTDFDPTDLTPRPLRVIHAHVTSEKPL